MKMFDAGKTRMIGLPCGEKTVQYVKPFSFDTGTSRTDRQTDGKTDRIAISISRVGVLTRDKKQLSLIRIGTMWLEMMRSTFSNYVSIIILGIHFRRRPL